MLNKLLIFYVVTAVVSISPLGFVVFWEYVKSKIGTDFFKEKFISISKWFKRYVDENAKYETTGYEKFILFFASYLFLIVGVILWAVKYSTLFAIIVITWPLIAYFTYHYKIVERYLRAIKIDLNNSPRVVLEVYVPLFVGGHNWTLNRVENALLIVKYSIRVCRALLVIYWMSILVILGASLTIQLMGTNRPVVLPDFFFSEISRVAQLSHDFHNYVEELLKLHFNFSSDADVPQDSSPALPESPPAEAKKPPAEAKKTPGEPRKVSEGEKKAWVIAIAWTGAIILAILNNTK